MGDDKKKRGLGRGLSALMEGAGIGVDEIHARGDEQGEGLYKMVPIELLSPHPDQPRFDFDEGELDDLAASIKASGIIQPLTVRSDPEKVGAYQIIAGERRWRAAQRAGQHTLPVIERVVSDVEALEIAVIENIQRTDLNVIEEAKAYQSLIEKFGFTQAKLATSMGKSRAHITNILRLLSLPEDVKQHVRGGALSMGHARALLASQKPSELAGIVMVRGLSVRETENLVKKHSQERPILRQKKPAKDADTRALEGQISANIGLPVAIERKSGQKSGTISIRYRSFEELEGVVALLCQEMI